jgi:hypothetical protein
VLWAGITYLRRLREQGETGPPRPRANVGRPKDAGGGIDYEELERAEREVKDLDVGTRPEDGFEGDDWGPGAAPRPPIA